MATKLTYKPKMQRCSCCGEEKPLSEFYTQAYTGIPTQQCKTCINVKRSVQRHKDRHSKFISKEKQRSMQSVDYSLSDWRDSMLHFGGRCAYCGAPEGRAKASKFDREHFVPLSRGGETLRHNIGPACRACNRGRGNKKIADWYRDQPFWTQERENKIIQWIGPDAAKVEGLK